MSIDESEEYVPVYDEAPDECIELARTDYVFFGIPLEEIQKKYKIPKDLIGELAFVGNGSWRELRAKVEEDELDGLINTNLYIIKKALNTAIGKVHKFLEEDSKGIEDWEQADRVMKVVGGLTKAAEMSKKLQEHRLPGKMKRLDGPDVPLLDGDSTEEGTEFRDEYSTKTKKELEEVEEAEELGSALDRLI